MAATKKVVTPATEKKTDAVKVEAPKAVVKEEPAKAAVKAEAPKATAEATAKKETAKKEAVKKEAAKKAPAKKVADKKAELKNELHIQFSGKSYSEEDLVKIAKDVWKYDLKQKTGDLTSVDLYVKPEEEKVYYVMNGEFTGSFDI